MNFSDIGIDTASLAGSLESRVAGHGGGAAAGIRVVRGSGLAVTGLEALRDFEGLAGQLHAYKLDVAKSMLEICGAIGARVLLVEASTSTHADAGVDTIVRDLKKLSILAVPLGIRIAFKALSWSRTVKDFVAAGDIVLRANCPNLGIAIDAFDVIAAGVSLDEIEGIDPEQIFLVQLSDYMWQEIRTTEEQVTTARHFRVFPGEGAHSEALANLVTRLDTIGYYGDYSFDVYNDDYLQMPPEVVAERARRAAEWLGETVLRRALPVPNMERLRPSQR